MSVTTQLYKMPPSLPAVELEHEGFRDHQNVIHWRHQWEYGKHDQQQVMIQTGGLWKSCGKPKVNVLQVGELWHCLIYRRSLEDKSQAGGHQENSSFKKVGINVVASQALEASGAGGGSQDVGTHRNHRRRLHGTICSVVLVLSHRLSVLGFYNPL